MEGMKQTVRTDNRRLKNDPEFSRAYEGHPSPETAKQIASPIFN